MKAGRATEICLLCVVGLLWNSLAAAEPLRLLVPYFAGPEPISQQVRTTIYFEMIQAFRSLDAPEKGGWILYGREPLAEAGHNAVVAAASWPSVRADLAVWGQVQQYAEGVAVQLYLSLTPLLKRRQVRPELWQIQLDGRNGPYRISLGLPGQFYPFEPLILTEEAIVRFTDPRGMILYSSRRGGEPIGQLAEVMRFYEIHSDAIKISTGGKKGWVRTAPLATAQSEAIDFSKAMVRLLRGDWRGARQSFKAVLERPNIPQYLRIHSLIYSGLAKEKSGFSGRNEFEQAYALNRLDSTAAAYLLMSRLADISRLQQQLDGELLQAEISRFKQELRQARNLFADNDPWFRRLQPIF
jgi:hypothetical protein